jgi:peptide/nickel transport system substrate-binding protein
MKSRLPYLFWLVLILSCCTAPFQERKERKEVVVRFPTDPESLSPINYSNVYALQVVNLLYQSLLTVDLEDDQIKPLLVSALPEITVTDSLSYFTFTLRQEATWDNQTPVTAHDVALSLKILKCPLLNNDLLRPRFDFIQDLLEDSTDNRKFTLVCKGYTEEMDLLTGDFFILPAYLLDPDNLLHPYPLKEFSQNQERLSKEPNIRAYASFFNSDRFTRNKEFLRGSGGYLLTEWKTGQHLTLRKKEGWWGDRLKGQVSYVTALPRQISFQILPDNNTALLALQNGQIDVFEEIPVTAFTELESNPDFTGKYKLFTPETYEFAFLGINSRLDKFADSRTRRALAHLVDVDNIIKATQAEFAAKTVGPVNPVNSHYYNASIRAYKPNRSKAEDLLRQAGWVRRSNLWQKQVNGKPLHLTLTVNYKAGHTAFENAALIFQQEAASVGIPVRLQPMEGFLLSQKLKAHEFELFFRSFSGSPFSFDFKPILHTENAVVNGSNYTGFGNAESDALLEAINYTRDKGKKALLLKRLQEILHEECTFIFLYFNKNRIAVSNRFSNVKISGIKPGYDLSAFAEKPH